MISVLTQLTVQPVMSRLISESISLGGLLNTSQALFKLASHQVAIQIDPAKERATHIANTVFKNDLTFKEAIQPLLTRQTFRLFGQRLGATSILFYYLG